MRGVIDLRQLNALPPDQAAALLLARTSDPTGPQDQEVLEAWLADDEANRDAWARMAAILAVFDAPDDDGVMDSLRQSSRHAAPWYAVRSRYWVAAAAAVAIVLAGSVMMTAGGLFDAGDREQIAQATRTGGESGGPATQIIRTAKGEIRAVPLPDGSEVTLDTGSAVEIDFTKARRDLKLLKGRANFDVRHDASRPFAVHAGNYEVIAVGTRFDVRLSETGVIVALIDGRVKTTEANGRSDAYFLNAGEQIVLENGKPPRLLPIDQARAGKWQDGMLTFNNQTLSEVVEEMNRYSSDRLVIRDPRVAALRVTGTFRAGDVARFARTIAAIYPVRIARNGRHEWEIKGKGAR